jgi:hypothetical protein
MVGCVEALLGLLLTVGVGVGLVIGIPVWAMWTSTRHVPSWKRAAWSTGAGLIAALWLVGVFWLAVVR